MKPSGRGIAIGSVALVLALPLLADDTSDGDQGPEELRTARVIYLNTTLAYVDAGREEGLREGDILEVVRDDVIVTSVQVSYLSSHRASCTFEDAAGTIIVGDTVRFTPHPSEGTSTGAMAETTASRSRRRGNVFRRAGLRGRIGVRYLAIKDRTDTGSDLSQPGLDLRLDGTNVGDSHIDLAVDVRSHRTFSTHSDGTVDRSDRTRVHRLAVSWSELHSGLRLTLGRQYSPALSAVSIFDGILADFAGVHWNVGAFTGTEPDPIDFHYSSEIRQHGLYTQVHNAPGARKRWAVSLGGVGSYQEGEVNREFLFLQSRYGGPRLSLYLAQEVDYNRDWRLELEGSKISPTSTLFNVQLRATRGLTFRAGYDNRRRVRLFRDRITPETEFDDSDRIGARVGWSWSGRHFRTGMDARSSDGSTVGDSESYSLYLGAIGFTSQRIGVNTRSTYYANDRAEGWLHSLRFGLNLGRRVRVELGGGMREEITLAAPVTEFQITWTTLDLDLNLGRHWYLLLSGEQNQSDDDDNFQLFSSLTYRF